ncbi:DUF58 domain-containing protein [Parenemella sanctibonifatiensis]|uniref:DUF58 domain-containing protein n=1 Tax=Parenemella sanctibonifatiensis TaxID=2016505 RepID=A0A255DZF7_9ACTN|nr:DUF58 domain-containing protein [Parenemella sanctibonifatiensis]OYN84626.1 hypothetical protein CGZ92_12385 [Parenemella sanctibonifatiensis]OYN92605.1 hypothetical protein CGZ91_03780 [Parenemella sanctibonifatiensis]
MTPQWRLSWAAWGALLVSIVGVVLAMTLHRPSLLVLAAPSLAYLFIVGSRRPKGGVEMTVRAPKGAVREGEDATIVATMSGLPDHSTVTVVHPRTPWVRTTEGGQLAVAAVGEKSLSMAIAIRPMRWGHHSLGSLNTAVETADGGWRAPGLVQRLPHLTVMPSHTRINAGRNVPSPMGVVGGHTSRTPGDSGELADVRMFRTGDRLKRINWRVTSRAMARGSSDLYVNSTWNERDTQVQLVLDVRDDLGGSTGLDGNASSNDVTVRLAAGLADHFLGLGDRVGMIDIAGTGRQLRATSGSSHLLRVERALIGTPDGGRSAHYNDGTVLYYNQMRSMQRANSALVVLFSPLIWPEIAQIAASSLVAGDHVVVIDTFPAHLKEEDLESEEEGQKNAKAETWQRRRERRKTLIEELQYRGVPVVNAHDSTSFGEVLLQVSRTANAPRARA